MWRCWSRSGCAAPELSALVARSPFGQGAAWPVVQTVQRDGICVQVIAPAPELTGDSAAAAQQLALRLAANWVRWGARRRALRDDRRTLLVNELAMRPHNSGHWTMDGSRTSQFEQHLRAVLDYPLGDTDAIVPVTVMANVLGAAAPPAMSLDERLHHLFARMPEAKVHLYGKAERPGRKVGHLNLLGTEGTDLQQLRDRAELAAHWLSHAQWTDGWDPHAAATMHGRTPTQAGVPPPVWGEKAMWRSDGWDPHDRTARVAVIMGSDSDWSVMADAAAALPNSTSRPRCGCVGASHPGADVRLRTRRRRPRHRDHHRRRRRRAHLPGMVASATPLPVIGVPVPLARLDGLDSLLSIVQMPAGAGGYGVHRRARNAACWRCGCWGRLIHNCGRASWHSRPAAETVRAKDAELQKRAGKLTRD
ncbi:AIR carboxylase family protein [Mycobacterium kansasii]|uniref:AIR carboxylase family protein n=1 Tax=Mycobacterium kansasii TaxID=1768 RepID=A0A1V3WKR5_MYCKA|nr:AIR carboxylase family protein [Mycobacterium kansasii]